MSLAEINCAISSELCHTPYFMILHTYTLRPSSLGGHVHTGPSGYPRIYSWCMSHYIPAFTISRFRLYLEQFPLHSCQNKSKFIVGSAAAVEPIWDPGVFTIIIIFFPFWWLSYNKLFYHTVSGPGFIFFFPLLSSGLGLDDEHVGEIKRRRDGVAVFSLSHISPLSSCCRTSTSLSLRFSFSLPPSAPCYLRATQCFRTHYTECILYT